MKAIQIDKYAKAKESILQAGADQYLDYRKENYWEKLSGVDYVIDTHWARESLNMSFLS